MSGRHDFYGPIHKGLRLGATRLLARLGAADWQDDAECAALVASLRHQLSLSRRHLQHEDAEINGLLAPGAADLQTRLDHDHADHYAMFEALDWAIDAVADALPEGRAEPGRRLYLLYSRHVGEDLLHMAREEEEALPALHRMFDDPALEAIHNRIKASIPLEQLVAYFSLVLPAVSPVERVMIMADMRANAPPSIYGAVRDRAARPHLDARSWRALEAALGALEAAA